MPICFCIKILIIPCTHQMNQKERSDLVSLEVQKVRKGEKTKYFSCAFEWPLIGSILKQA